MTLRAFPFLLVTQGEVAVSGTKREHMKQRLWTGDFTLMLAIAFCAFVSCQALNNGTPLYITRIGGSTGFAGVLILDFSIAAAIARLFAGRIIDRMGRKRIMVVGALLLIAGSALAIPLPGFYPQIVLRALQGIGFACVTTASATAAADVLPCERLGEGIGYYALGQSLGMAFGPAFGIFLCSLVFTESLFVGVAGVGAVLLILVMCCNYEKHVERLPETSEYRVLEERRRRLAKEADSGDIGAIEEEVEDADRYRGLAALFEKRALVGALPMIVICLGFAIPVSYTALYAQSLGLSNAGMFFFVGAIAMTASRFLGGRLLDVMPPRVLFLLTNLCGIAMFLVMAFVHAEWMLYVGGFFFGVSMGFAFPLLNSMAVKNTPPERWGAANAMFLLANDMGVGLGASLWGFVADSVGFLPVMLGGAAMFAIGYAIALIVFPRKK